jgi:ribosomal protein L31E
MCTYNGAAYLPEQLASLAAQTRLPDELVVRDDQSDDGQTREIVKAFARNSPFPIRLSVNRKQLGSKKNFAKAISRCRGDVILLCDQDDVWLPNKLAKIEDAFQSKPETGLVFSDAEVVDEELRPLDYLAGHFGAEPEADLKAGRFFHALLRQNLITGATMAFRSRLKKMILPIPDDTVLQHDAWIALIIAAVSPMVFLKQQLIKYRQHDGQQIGVSIKGSRFEQRSGPLIDAVNSEPYPTAEIHAFKTVYARLITKCSALVASDKLNEIREWILRLEGEQAVLENQRAPAAIQRTWEEMEKHLESQTIQIALYIKRDLWRLRYRLGVRDLRAVSSAIRAKSNKD